MSKTEKKVPTHISPSYSGILSASDTLLGANESRERTWWLGEFQEKWGREKGRRVYKWRGWKPTISQSGPGGRPGPRWGFSKAEWVDWDGGVREVGEGMEAAK